MALFLTTIFWLNLSATDLPGQWTHPFANQESSASVYFPAEERNIQILYDYDSIPLVKPIAPILCGDIDGDHINEIVGISIDQQTFFQIDFKSKQVTSIPIPAEPDDLFTLSALVDGNQDRTLDILYTKKSATGQRTHELWSLRNKTMVFSIPASASIQDETAFTCLDTNFDGKPELICVGTNPHDKEIYGVLSIYDTQTLTLRTSCEVLYPIPLSSLAVTQIEDYQETYFVFATDYSLQATEPTAPKSQCTLYTYLVTSSNPFLEEAWSQPFRQGIIPSRLSIAKTIDEVEAVVVGTRLDPHHTPPIPRAVSRLNLIDGGFIDETSIPEADCLQLSVANMDGDIEEETIYYESYQNVHVVHFSENRDRVFGMPNSVLFVGTGAMFRDAYPYCPSIQQVGSRYLFHLLNNNLDPNLTAFSIRTSFLDTPIMGDVDGNNRAEVIWVSGEAAPSIHRLGFFDPDKDPSVRNWIQY